MEGMPDLQLIFGTYNSIPLGEPDSTYEDMYRSSFKPFLSTLYHLPDMSCVLYYSGTLLQWLEKKHPEFLDVLSEMVSRKQVELLGGAFYDPILTIIPRSDGMGQIEFLTTYIRKIFGKRPRGAWIPETEWEPWLASTLRTCGMDYTFLGEYHFNAAGIRWRYVPYITEDQGKTLFVFPLFEKEGDTFWDLTPKEALNLLLSHASQEEDRLVTLLLNGTEFGESKGRKWFQEKRLESFLMELRAANGIKVTQPGRYLRSSRVGSKTYFPCGSREQTMVHALQPDRAREYISLKNRMGLSRGDMLFGGGFFRQFLVLYPESNLLYAKMQYTHMLVNSIRRDKYRKTAAREELWRGEFGGAYWPGPGRDYSYNGLRKQAYKALISAERITRLKGVFIPSIVVTDFDMDGREEFLYQGYEMNAYIHSLGGVLFELDSLNKPWNYLNTFITRTAERAVPKYSFMDHLFPPGTRLKDFASQSYEEWGDFLEQPYEVVKCDKERSELVLQRLGRIKQGKEVFPLRILKKFIFKNSTINLYYSITNPGDTLLSFGFGSEINISFLQGDGIKIYKLEGKSRDEVPSNPQELTGIGEILFEDLINEVGISIATLETASGWSFPVEGTVWNEGKGSSNGYQCSSFVPRWKLDLAPHGTWENRITLRIEKLDDL